MCLYICQHDFLKLYNYACRKFRHSTLPSRSASKAAMCSWAISTMKRRQRKPLMMTDGCTQETLEKSKLVSIFQQYHIFSNIMHDPVLCKKFNSGNSWVDLSVVGLGTWHQDVYSTCHVATVELWFYVRVDC